ALVRPAAGSARAARGRALPCAGDPRRAQHAAHARGRGVGRGEAAVGAVDRDLGRGTQRPPRATDRGDRRGHRAPLFARARLGRRPGPAGDGRGADRLSWPGCGAHPVRGIAMSDLLFQPLTRQIEALARRKVSALELMQETLARIEATRATLNSFSSVAERDGLLAEARAADQRIASGDPRALEGIPLGVKDLFHARGLVTSMGSVPYRDRVASED